MGAMDWASGVGVMDRKKPGKETLVKLPALRPVPPPPRARYPAGGPVASQWVRIDVSGKSSGIAVDRHKLTQELGVQLRDLRLLDPKCSGIPAAILPRDGALVVALENIRAVITRSYVLVMNPEGDGVAELVRELESRLVRGTSLPGLSDLGLLESMGTAEGLDGVRNVNEYARQADLECNSPTETPFELKALEVCLESVCSTVDRMTTELEAVAFPALDALTFKVTTQHLQRVRTLKSRMVRVKTRVESVREVLEKFLEDDGDMRALNLTKQQGCLSARKMGRNSICRDRRSIDDFGDQASDTDSQDEDLQEVEMLLEAYFMQLDNTLNRLQTLCEYIDDTEDYINIEQDKHRNQLLQLELLMSAGTFTLAFVAVISGIFGMNLSNGNDPEEDSTETFILVSTLSTMGAIGVFVLLIVFCRWKGLMFN